MQARVALVTGGTGGIGSSILLKLASMGHKVATNYRDEGKARAWQTAMRAAGVDVVMAQGDVSSPEQAESFRTGYVTYTDRIYAVFLLAD